MARVNLIDVPGFEIGGFEFQSSPPPAETTRRTYAEDGFIVFEFDSLPSSSGTLRGLQFFSVGTPVLSLEVVGADFSFAGLPVQTTPAAFGAAFTNDVYPYDFQGDTSGLMSFVRKNTSGESAEGEWTFGSSGTPLEWGPPPTPDTFAFLHQFSHDYTAGGPVTARLRLLVEAEIESPPAPDPDPDPDPGAPCFWTDLVNLRQICAPGPAPGPSGGLTWVYAHANNYRLSVEAALAPPPEPGPDEVMDTYLDGNLTSSGGVFVTPTGATLLFQPMMDMPDHHTRLRCTPGLYRIPAQGVEPDYMEWLEFVQELPPIEGELETPSGWPAYGIRGYLTLPLPFDLPTTEPGYVYVIYSEDIETAPPTGDFSFAGGLGILAPIVRLDELETGPIPFDIPSTEQHSGEMYITGATVRMYQFYDTGWQPTRFIYRIVVGAVGYAEVCNEPFEMTVGGDTFDGTSYCS